MTVRAFTGPGAEERATRAGRWLKALAGDVAARDWCVARDIRLTKATGGAGNMAGGFMVPTELDTAIIAVRDAVGAFRAGADVRTARTDRKVHPRRAGGLVANFVEEGAPIPESALTFDAVGATLRKLAILARSSAELWEDSAADLAEFIAVEIGYAFAAKEDDCGFNGDGTDAYGRISGLGAKLAGAASAISAASGHDTFLKVDDTDIANLMGGVIASAHPGAAWYVSALGFAQILCRLAGGHGQLITRTGGAGLEAWYLGYPVRFSASLPNVATSLTGAPMLFFGNLRMASVLVEHAAGTVIAVSMDRTVESDEVLVRGTRRGDIVNHATGDADTRGPIAALFGA